MTTIAAIVIVAAAFIGGYFLGRGGGALRRHWLWAVPLAAVVAGGALYAWRGSAGSVSLPAPPPGIAAGLGATPAPLPRQAPPGGSGGDLAVMAKRLAEKMAQDPNNGEGWLLLARTYGELHQAEAAEQAYARAAQLQKPDATVLADWADARVMARGRQWDGVARELVERALAADPRHPKALALAGSAAFERADYQAAIAYWRRMQAVAAADSMDAKLAAANIAEATARAAAGSTGIQPELGAAPLK